MKNNKSLYKRIIIKKNHLKMSFCGKNHLLKKKTKRRRKILRKYIILKRNYFK
ncbi:hypothetical protein [Candidatus Vidania fulgoroideorum]